MRGQLLLRHLTRTLRTWNQPMRMCSTSSVPSTGEPTTYPVEQYTPEYPIEWWNNAYPTTGNRDVTGHGISNECNYIDDESFPCPGVRFKANTPEILALREKEQGDWNNLTLDEKRELYRASYRRTLEELTAPTGLWKRLLIGFLAGLLATQMCVTFETKLVLPPGLNEEFHGDEHERCLHWQIQTRNNPIRGIGSTYDYEKGEFRRSPEKLF